MLKQKVQHSYAPRCMWLFGSIYEKKLVEVACIKFLCFIECPLQVALAIYLARLFFQGGRSNAVGMFLFCILWLAELVGAFVSECVGQLHLISLTTTGSLFWIPFLWSIFPLLALEA